MKAIHSKFRKQINPLLLLLLLVFLIISLSKSANAWMQPDGECSYEELGHCCRCVPCEGTFNFGSPKVELTPITNPVPLKGERFGTNVCISRDDNYILGATKLSEEIQLGGAVAEDKTEIHLFEIESSLMDYTSDDGYDISHGALSSKIPESQGHVLECGEDYLFVSDGKEIIQVFVKTTNPLWSPIYVISPPEGQGSDSSFGKFLEYCKQTKELFVSDPNSKRVYIYKIQTPGSSLSNYALPLKFEPQGSYEDAPYYSDVSRGAISVSYPYLFVACSVQSICIYKRDAVSRDWKLTQTIQLDDTLGSTISSSGKYFAVNYELPRSNWVDIFFLQDGSTQWSFLQRIDDPASGGVLQEGNQTAPVYNLEEEEDERESYFGWSFVLNSYYNSDTDFGTKIVISDPVFRVSASASGRVYLYESSGPPDWTFSLCQVFSDEPSSFQSMFGFSLDLSNTRLVVGAPETLSTYNGNGKLFQYTLSRDFRCLGCDGRMNSCASDDLCGECNGDNSSCAGCDGIPNSGLEFDDCQVCNGTSSSCISIFDSSGQTHQRQSTPEELLMGDQPADSSINCETSRVIEYIARVPVIPRISADQIQIQVIKYGESCGTFELVRHTRITRPTKSAPYYNKLHDSTYFRLFFNYTLSKDQSECVDSIPFIDFLDVQIGAFKNDIPMVTPKNVTISIQHSGCVGCDSVLGATTFHVLRTDRCNVCGGDGTTCLDCAGVPFGDSSLDACNTCTTIQNHNKTCMSVVAPVHFEISCAQAINSNLKDIIVIYPENKSRRLEWTISTQPNYGRVTLGKAKGDLRYSPLVTVDHEDSLEVLLRDKWNNADVFTVDINIKDCHVIGCDGVKGSGMIEDRCGICGGNDACVDCEGVVNGGAVVDPCGVCGGDGSTCDTRVAIAVGNAANVVIEGGADVPILTLILVPLIAFGLFIIALCCIFGLLIGCWYADKKRKDRLRNSGVVRTQIGPNTTLEYDDPAQQGQEEAEGEEGEQAEQPQQQQLGINLQKQQTQPIPAMTPAPPRSTLMRKRTTIVPVSSGSEVANIMMEQVIDENGNILSSNMYPTTLAPFRYPSQQNAAAAGGDPNQAAAAAAGAAGGGGESDEENSGESEQSESQENSEQSGSEQSEDSSSNDSEGEG